MSKQGFSSVAMALNFEGGDVPEWVELIPAGHVEGRDGRWWVNDAPELVLAAFVERAKDLPWDVEHSTELKAPKGEPAPAVGWVVELKNRDGAVWGRVEWNENGREAVASRTYRYYSPVFDYQKDTRRIVRLTSVGLTNRHNLYVQALNSEARQQAGEEESEMTLDAALCRELGIAESATAQDALTAIRALKDDVKTAQNNEGQADLDKVVPRADFDQMKERAEEAEAKLKEREETAMNAEIEKVIGEAIEGGKVAPASKDYYTAMCRENDGLLKFKDFIKTAPAIVKSDPATPGGQPEGTGTALNSEELAVCRQLGIEPKEYQASKKQEDI